MAEPPRNSLLAFVLALWASIVGAQDALPARLSWQGFGTLGVTCSNNEEADFVYNTVPNGPGRTRPCDAGLDSALGIQAGAILSRTLTGTLQLVSQRRA